MNFLFGKKSKTMVFVDYEYWFYSYKNLIGIRPNPQKFRDTLEKEFELADIMIFGDFSPVEINAELRQLRSITNTIIETGNTVQRRKKDMTDFVMLDYIYRCEDDNKKIDTYIIFSGDGHFQSVVKHLVQRKKKKVIVCGIKDSISKQLQSVACEVRFVPAEEELKQELYKVIASNMDYVSGRPGIIPTFNSTIDAVTSRSNIDRENVRAALSDMLSRGYIYQKESTMDYGRKVKVLESDWDMLEKDGVWRKEN